MALAFVLIAAGVTLYVAIGHRPRRSSAIIGDLPTTDLGTPPDPNEGGFGASTDGRLQFADKKDPARLQAELAYATLDPLGGGYYKLGRPKAWIYFRDGRVLYLQADAGRFRMPGRAQRPESGDLTGGVLWRMFNPHTTPDGKKDLTRPIDIEKDTPLLIGYTPSASFDATLLEISSDDPVSISWATGTFEADGLLVRLNELRERIEVLKTGKGQIHASAQSELGPKQKPAPPALAADAPTKPPASTPAEQPASKPTTTLAKSDAESAPPSAFVGPPKPPKEALYRCLVTENVTLSQRGRSLTSDTLEIFARTLDNRLPANAIAPLAFAGQLATPADSKPQPSPASAGEAPKAPAAPHKPEPASEPSAIPAPKPVIASSTPEPKPMYAHTPDDIVLAWSGPMVITPAQADPLPKLLAGGNDIGVRFSTERPGGLSYMTLSDPATKAVAVCSTIEYGATTRDLSVLSGAGQDSVSVFAPEIGRAVVPGFSINLGTGIAHVPGGGVLGALRGLPAGLTPAATPAAASGADASKELPSDLARQITWSDQADFQLAKVGGKLSTGLEMASFAGQVVARDRSSSIAGDAIRAEFAPPAAAAAGAKDAPSASSLLRRLNVRGNVIAVAGEKVPDPRALPALDPHLSAEELDVSFAPVPGSSEVEPTFVQGRGKVVAANRDAAIRAGKIEARLGKRPGGESGVLDMVATDKAEFERADGVFATADVIRADAVKNFADLTGKDVRIGRGASQILCTRARLDGQAETLVVNGAGQFEHRQLDSSSQGTFPAVIAAGWDKGMVYDNTRGTIDCDGRATFSSTSIVSVQKAAAEQIRIMITPGSGADKLTQQDGAVVSDRRVLRAEAIGTGAMLAGAADKPASGSNAKLESYRFASPAQPGVQGPREQVLYIEGPRIVYDAGSGGTPSPPPGSSATTTGTFSVPASGFAVIRDERTAPPGTENSPAPPKSASTPTFVLGANSGATRGTSRLAWGGSMNYDLASGRLVMQKDVELAHLPPGANKAARLVASTISAMFGTSASQGSQLLRAEAAGAVYAETGPAGDQQKMFADHFIYDGTSGKAEAWADDKNRVTFYQDKRPTPVVAKRLLWDLISDRVEITEAAPIIAPR